MAQVVRQTCKRNGGGLLGFFYYNFLLYLISERTTQSDADDDAFLHLQVLIGMLRTGLCRAPLMGGPEEVTSCESVGHTCLECCRVVDT